MDNKTTTEQTTENSSCCKTSCKCSGNHKWLWMLVRIALLLAILGLVFKMGVRVGMGGGMGGYRDMMHKGMVGGKVGCQMNKGNWGKDDNKMKGDSMIDKSTAITPATGEVVVSTGEIVGTGLNDK